MPVRETGGVGKPKESTFDVIPSNGTCTVTRKPQLTLLLELQKQSTSAQLTQNYTEDAQPGAAGYKTTNPAAVYKGFNISINRPQLQKIARLEQWNFDLKTLSEALLFRNTQHTDWRVEGRREHTYTILP